MIYNDDEAEIKKIPADAQIFLKYVIK